MTGIVPYVLTGTVVVNPGEKNEQTGRLTIYRDRDRSRVDLQFRDYSETWISAGDRRYIPRGKQLLNATGLSTLDESWDPGRPPRTSLAPAYKFGKVKKEAIDGHPAWCLDKKWPSGKDRLCFDAERSVLISDHSEPENNRKYVDYTSNEQQTFPRLVKIDNKWIAPFEVRDISVSRGSFDDKLFRIPTDAIEFENCKDIRPPLAVSTPEPDFSHVPHHRQQLLVFSAIIAKDGRVQEAWLLNPSSDDLSAKARDAVMRWKFKPAICSGQPINVEIRLEIVMH